MGLVETTTRVAREHLRWLVHRALARPWPAGSLEQRLSIHGGCGQRPGLLEVNAWSASEVVLNLVPIVGYQPYPLDELLLMVAAFAYHQPDVVLDIGTHQGKSARIWYELSKLASKNVSIHTMDLLDPQHLEFPGRLHGKFIRGTPVRQHIGDGYNCAREIIAADPSRCFLIFLDGDHSYDTVLRELDLARMVEQGCLLVHDTLYQPESAYNHGPYLAIEEFARTFAFKQIIHVQTGLPGMSYLAVS